MMRRTGLLLIAALWITTGVFAQDDFFAQLDSFDGSVDHIQPLIQLGWGYPYDLAWTPDGNMLVVATGAGLWFYDAHDLMAEPRFVETDAHSPYHIAISPDGTLLATGGNDTRLWDIASGALLDILPTGDGVGGLAFNRDGSLLAVTKDLTAQYTNQLGIYIYDTQTGREQAHIFGRDFFSQVQFMPDGDHLLVQDAPSPESIGLLINWRTEEYQVVDSHSNLFLLLPDGTTLFDYIGGVGLRQFDLTVSTTEPAHLAADDGTDWLSLLAMIDDVGQIIALTRGGDVILWDRRTFDKTAYFNVGVNPTSAALSPDGTRLALVDKDGLLRVINPLNGSTIAERQHFIPRADPMQFVGGNRLAFVMNQREIWVWNFDSLEIEQILEGHEGAIATLAVDPDSETLYSAGRDGTARSWNLATGESRMVIGTSGTSITAIALGGGDDIYVATCTLRDGVIERYALDSGESIGFSHINSQTGQHELVPAIETDNCLDQLITVSGSLVYSDKVNVYVVRDNLVDSIPPITPAFEFPPQVDYPRLIQAKPSTWPLLIYEGVALAYSPDVPYTLYPVVSHAYSITALAWLNDLFYVSAACGRTGYGYSGDSFCSGADMVISGGFPGYYERYTLNAHSGAVYRLVVNGDMVFASASDDGTILIWGVPLRGTDFTPIRVISR
ncbi:MAG: WD40 repeat domain-containing protein [Anaerolineaceae bacterium]|nr:WD40 repeat domain-containing protein [Anaerolineaceae bacterium]